MPHQIRLMLVLLLVVLLLAALPASLAQDDTFGLSQADYSLLADANELTAAVTSFEFDYSLDITVTGAPANSGRATFTGEGALVTGDDAAFRMTINGASDMGVPRQTFNGELRVVDGIIYDANTDPATGEPIEWNSQTAEEFWALVSQLSGTPVDPDTFATAFDPNQLYFLLNALNPSDFLFASREADEPVDGQDSAHYIVVTDFDAFFSSPFMSAMMSSQPDLPTAQQMANAFQDSTFRIEEWVGLNDNMVHRLLFDLSLNIDPRDIGSFGDQLSLGMTFDITFRRFNEAITISAPGDVEVVLQPTPVVPQTVFEGEPISANSPTAVQLGNQGTIDLIYTSSAPETVNIIVRSTVAGGVDTTLEVIGPNGNTLAYNDDHNTTRGTLGNFDSAIENLELPSAGTYIIRVGSYTNSGSGNVEVLVESDAPPEVVLQPTVEPTAIVPVQEEQTAFLIPGALTADGGFTYPFTATRGQTVTIIVTDGDGPLDPRVALLDPLFIGLAENDDHNTGLSQLDTQDSMIVNYIVPTDGTYYILVTDNAGTAGPFELVLVRGGGVPDLDDVRAGGGTTPIEVVLPTAVAPVEEEANPVSVGEEITLSLDGRTPTTYTFNGTAGQTVTISAQAVNPASPDMDVQVTVYDPNGTQLGYNDDHGGSDSDLGQRDSQITALTLPVTGAYRIEVDSWFDVSGEVLLTVEEE